MNILKTWRQLWDFVDGKTSYVSKGVVEPPEDPQALKKEHERLTKEREEVIDEWYVTPVDCMGQWYRDCEELTNRIVDLEAKLDSQYDLETERAFVTALVMFIRTEWKTRNTSQASRMYVKQSVKALRKIWNKDK